MGGRRAAQSDISRIKWYIEHRLEYLENHQLDIKDSIEQSKELNYDLLKEFMENRGRLRELKNIRDRIEQW